MSDRLQAGEQLNIDDRLVSPNGRYILLMQTDSNLVLYQDSVDVNNAYWSTDTLWLPQGERPTRVVMQPDAQLAMYDPSGVARWSSGTWGAGYLAPYVALGDDGNLVVYHDGSEPVWASGGVDGTGAIPAQGEVDVPSGPTDGGGSAGQGEVTAHLQGKTVGDKMEIDVTATLYRDGLLMVESQERNNNDFHGMRGRIRVVCVQGNGASCAMSPDFQCETRGSRWDVFTPNQGYSSFSVQLPQVVGQYTAYLHIYASQGRDPVPAPQQWIDNLKQGQEIYEEIRPYLEQIAKIAAATQGAPVG